MGILKTIFIIFTVMLMFITNLYEIRIFSNGEKFQAIFDFAMMAFNVSFWTWLMMIFKK